MKISTEQFTRQLIASGLYSVGDFSEIVAVLPATCREDGETLAQELVRQKKLTPFQAQQVYQGKVKFLVLGNYVVLDKLGQGGMGMVFKAEHRRMERLVALKILSPQVVKNPTALLRFQREVKAAAKLEHANIVTAHDADEANGIHFLVMQFVDGMDLSALVRKNGPLSVEKSLSCVIQAARGLAYAHSRGVIHRDIKPANLLLDRDGVIKILDMGLARLEDAGTDQDHLTGIGQILGTADYMAPEQAQDTATADARSDVYSLGVTLWYLLTGKSIYEAESVVKKLMAHQNKAIPSLRDACPAATANLEAIFTKMVAKSPTDRHQQMSDVIADLERCQQGPMSLPDVLGSSPPSLLSQDAEYESFYRLADSPSKSPSMTTQSKYVSATQPKTEPTSNLSAADTDPNSLQTLAGTVPRKRKRRRPVVQAWWERNRQPLSIGAGTLIVVLVIALIWAIVGGRSGTAPIDAAHIATNLQEQPEATKSDNTTGVPSNPAAPVNRQEDGSIAPSEKPTDKPPTPPTTPATKAEPMTVATVTETNGVNSISLGNSPARAIAPFDAQQAKRHQEEWAKHLNLPVEYTNSIGMKFVLIPPGEFEMGASPEEVKFAMADTGLVAQWRDGVTSAQPLHKVSLTKPFYLGKYEVTQDQFDRISRRSPSHFSSTGAGKALVEGQATGSHPIEMISWDNSSDFCVELHRLEFLTKGRVGVTGLAETEDFGYRLPTEAEWEFACRAGTTKSFSHGSTDKELTQGAWFSSSLGNRTHAIGLLQPNSFGLYDMHGNVWEWVQDFWNLKSYMKYGDSTAIDPVSREGLQRVIRGGSYFDYSSRCMSAYRHTMRTSHYHMGLGFRVVLEPQFVQRLLAGRPTEEPTKTLNPFATQSETETVASAAVRTAGPATPIKDSPALAIAPFDAQQAKRHQEEWAKHLNLPIEFTNSVGMKFILIPPGEFLMGSTPDDLRFALTDARWDSHWKEGVTSTQPQIKVLLTNPIYMGIHEVTQAQFAKVSRSNPSFFSPANAGKAKVISIGTDSFPTEMISWDSSAEFCIQLNQLESLEGSSARDTQSSGKGEYGYRLPTEAEWEFACRAGTITKFNTGDTESELAQGAWFAKNSGGRTHAVGTLKPNAFGLYDMHGNVWEWVQDYVSLTFHSEQSGRTVINPSVNNGQEHVIRGGNWSYNAKYCLSFFRHGLSAAHKGPDVGFRVVLDPRSVQGLLARKEEPRAMNPMPSVKEVKNDSAVGLIHGLRFNGDGSHVQFPTLRLNSKESTVEAWMIARSVTTPTCAIFIGGNTQNRIWFHQGVCGVSIRCATDGAHLRYESFPVDAVFRRMHVACVWNGKDLYRFVDGVPFKCKELGKQWAIGPQLADRQVSALGSICERRGNQIVSVPQPGEFDTRYEGIMDELRVSNTVRYTAQFDPASEFESDKETVALYHFDEGQGTKLRTGKIISVGTSVVRQGSSIWE